MIETCWDKRRIFESLNVIEWGTAFFSAPGGCPTLLQVSSQLVAGTGGKARQVWCPTPRLRSQPQPGDWGRKAAIILARMASAEIPESPLTPWRPPPMLEFRLPSGGAP